MGLRSGKSNNRKLNRADAGRSANRRVDFYDLRSQSGAGSESPTGEGERYYEDEFTEDGNGGSSYGTVGRYPDYTGVSSEAGRTDERPYRERHRVEMKDGEYSRSSGGYYAGRGPEVPSLSRGEGRRSSRTSGFERDRYGAGSSASYGTGSSAPYGAGSSTPYGAGSSSSYRAGSSAPYGADSTSSYGTDSSSSYGTGNRVVRGNVPANRRDSARTGTEREISADLFVPNTFSSNGRRSRMTRRSRESIQEPGGNGLRGSTYGSGSRGRSFDSASMGGSADRWRNSRTAGGRTQENSYPGLYPAPDNLGSSRRSSGTGARTTGGYYRGGAGQGRRGGTYPGQDYFYEEELPSDNILWDGIGDDPNETPAQKRARQREQIRQEREKELRDMFFRLGAGAAVALVAVIIVIVIAVIGLRRKDSNTVATDTGTQQTTDVSGNKTDSSADSGPESGAEAGNPALTEETAGNDDFSADAREDQEGTANGPQDTSAETPEQTGTAEGENGENAGQQENTAGQQESTAGQQENTAGQQDNTGPDAGNPAEQGDTQQLSPTDSWTEEARQGIAADGNGAGVTYARQDEWNLILVNPWHKLPEGYTVETTALLNGESVDSRCYEPLSRMLNDCQEQSGGIPIVCSSYRPHEKQVRLYDDQVKSLMSTGKTKEEAEKEAGTVVAVPGTSEHELGLAVDICDSENQLLDESQANTSTQKWLMENCWKYGFILRYPQSKSDITGIIYEPWHYRYVGIDIAREIHDRGICLEEYLAE